MSEPTFFEILQDVLGHAAAVQLEMERDLEDAHYDEMAQAREDAVAIGLSEYGEWLSEMESVE